MNPSGGLRWHWRAWRAATAWAPTRTALAQWLQSCQPHSRQLLLLGPSAGWMLPTDWLLRFESVTAYDLDPWAKPLFAQRHGRRLTAAGVHWRFHTQDALADLPALLRAYPHACLLFDNLLGQLRFHAPQPTAPADLAALEARLQALRADLAGREWGSIHDLLSGRVNIEIVESAIFPPISHSLAGEGVAAELFPQGACSPWLDHLTTPLLPPGTPVSRMAWAFAPDYWHVLEAGWVGPAQVHAPAVDSRLMTQPQTDCRTAL